MSTKSYKLLILGELIFAIIFSRYAYDKYITEGAVSFLLVPVMFALVIIMLIFKMTKTKKLSKRIL
ncbi:hypothetical protein [Oceanirhabdus sp. W0125-5]|uniref:hypothetical protein n=1 Tax=Oceanirhabdus sp. W0125-5 TaxID=2999116 RepID=UPI0022F32A0D|nr:hypothetical protein [Oceanirhabdus sp. W0125-5]WBW96451.1 hypothetical protein OW730_22565 [Oceanirhabdus sp. W0125-5]